MLVVAAAVCGHHCNWNKTPAFVAFYGGIGAGIGALVDLAIRDNKAVFLPPEAAKPSASLAPLIERGRRGVRVALRF